MPNLLFAMVVPKLPILKYGTYTVSSVVPVMFSPPNTTDLSPVTNEFLECINDVLPDAIE